MPKVLRAHELEIRKENVPGHTAYSWLIHSTTNIGTTLRTIWLNNATADLTVPTEAVAMTISSASTADTLGGTGANVAVVQYLDADYKEVEDILNLNGQTGVSLSVPAIRVNRVIVGFSGSGKKNAGRLYVGVGSITAGVPATSYLIVEANDGISRQGLFTVPAGYYAYFTAINVTSQSSKPIEVQLQVTRAGTNTELRTVKYELSAASPNFAPGHVPSLGIDPKSDIRWLGLTDTGTAALAMVTGIYLIRSTEVRRRAQ